MQQFVLGYDKVPEWFNVEAKRGKIRITYNDKREIVSADIVSGLSKYIAVKGDTIINGKNGIVVKKNQPKMQIQNQKQNKKNREKVEEE